MFAHAQTGVSTNHSSEVASTTHTEDAGHAQQDDELEDAPLPQDPNMAGMTQTEDCYTWRAGSLDGWCENDDYREFFGNSVGSNGMHVSYASDGDYDDNGGIPLALGHTHGMRQSVKELKDTSTSGSTHTLGFPVGVIVRRL